MPINLWKRRLQNASFIPIRLTAIFGVCFIGSVWGTVNAADVSHSLCRVTMLSDESWVRLVFYYPKHNPQTLVFTTLCTKLKFNKGSSAAVSQVRTVPVIPTHSSSSIFFFSPIQAHNLLCYLVWNLTWTLNRCWFSPEVVAVFCLFVCVFVLSPKSGIHYVCNGLKFNKASRAAVRPVRNVSVIRTNTY